MKSILSTITLITSALMYSPIVSSNDLYDIDEFVVSGVSLGDDVDQVIKGLSEFYSINVEDLELITEFNGPAIEYIEYRGDDFEVIAYLEPTDEEDKSYTLVLFTVSYDNVIDDYKTYASTFTKKYGTPTKILEVSRGSTYGWCQKIDSTELFCDDAYPMFYIGRKMIFLGTN